MSAVYFHSVDAEDARLRGSERAYAGCMANDFFLQILGLDRGAYIHTEQKAKWRKAMPVTVQRYIETDDAWRFLGLHLTQIRTGDEEVTMHGEPVNVFGMICQTLLDAGGDALKLLARIHGQSEIHGWIDGPNRYWLAGIIENGRSQSVLRADQGWEDVATLLKITDKTPIVMSYSVCHSFPNPQLGGIEPDEEGNWNYDEFYKLPFIEQWEVCMKTLRAECPLLEMRPDNWSDYKFYSGVNAFAYREYVDTL